MPCVRMRSDAAASKVYPCKLPPPNSLRSWCRGGSRSLLTVTFPRRETVCTLCERRTGDAKRAAFACYQMSWFNPSMPKFGRDADDATPVPLVRANVLMGCAEHVAVRDAQEAAVRC